MKIALLQTDIAWRNVSANISQAELFMKQRPGADLYVLPEMWCTGFDVEPSSESAKQSEEGLEWMKRQAQALRCHIAGSFIWKDPEDSSCYTNTLFMVSPDGNASRYDKRHLFGYGGETIHYRAGKSRQIISACGVRILPQVCYDLRFPVFSRNHADAPYDLIIYVASWPESRQSAWDTLLRARAIENQCYVAGVNRVGNDPRCHYAGGTALIDPYGKTVFTLGNRAGIEEAELDLERLEHFREKFPVLRDADEYIL